MSQTNRRTTFLISGLFVAAMLGAIGGWLWWSGGQLERPGQVWLDVATEHAGDWAADAELVLIDGHRIRPDGAAALLSPGDSGWRFHFRSDQRASSGDGPREPVTPGGPRPIVGLLGCFEFTVRRGTGRQSNLVRTSGQPVRCPAGNVAPGMAPPRCSMNQVWARAEDLGAPNPGFAKINAAAEDGTWQWSFRIPDHVDLTIADDC